MCLFEKCWFSQTFPHVIKKKKSLSKFSTDKFAKNNTELNNRALIQCDNAGSAFQLEIYPFAGIIWRILQETNEL